jgi:hypothetical protein
MFACFSDDKNKKSPAMQTAGLFKVAPKDATTVLN